MRCARINTSSEKIVHIPFPKTAFCLNSKNIEKAKKAFLNLQLAGRVVDRLQQREAIQSLQPKGQGSLQPLHQLLASLVLPRRCGLVAAHWKYRE